MSKKLIVQVHHIEYEPKEITVRVLRGEHFWITRLQWFKSLTAGAKKAIRHILRTTPTRRLPRSE